MQCHLSSELQAASACIRPRRHERLLPLWVWKLSVVCTRGGDVPPGPCHLRPSQGPLLALRLGSLVSGGGIWGMKAPVSAQSLLAGPQGPSPPYMQGPLPCAQV